MTTKEYKQIKDALDKLAESFIKSLDKFNNEIKKSIKQNYGKRINNR